MKNKIFILGSLIVTCSLNAQYTTPNTGVNWTLNDIMADSPGTVTMEGGGLYTPRRPDGCRK